MINDRVVILDVSVQVQRRIQEGEWMKCSSYCVVFCTFVSRFDIEMQDGLFNFIACDAF